jgi:cytochrome c oxidase subunit II
MKATFRRFLAVTIALASAGAWANPERWQLNLTKGVTSSSRIAYESHMTMFYICCVIGAIVFGAMFYSMYKHRKSAGAVAAKFSHNTTAEIIWTVVPIAILVVAAIPATRHLTQIYDVGGEEMTVKITGYQWKWKYEFLGADGKPTYGFISSLDRKSDFARRVGSGIDPQSLVGADGKNNYLLEVDNHLKLPTNTKIRFVITGDDVIHSWWVPELGWKQDAIPGFINEAWTKIEQVGTYRGQCTELCGKDHGFMPIVVDAVPKAEFDSWLNEQRARVAAESAAVAPALTPAPVAAPAAVAPVADQANASVAPPNA